MHMLCRFWRKPKYKVELRCGDAGAWYWRIVSTINGQVIATSETYSGRLHALETALSVAKEGGWRMEACA
jgi:uncharacterized protein YegP (UPF0339 family)